MLTDLRGDAVHDISVKPAGGPAYLLTRAKRGDADLALSPVPKGRKPASSMAINGQADGLTAFNFDDVRAVPATAPKAVDRATFRTFDGQVFELTGHKDADKAYISVHASRDPALAAQFPEPAAEKPAAADGRRARGRSEVRDTRPRLPRRAPGAAPAEARGPERRAPRRPRQRPRIRDPALQIRLDLQTPRRPARAKTGAGPQSRQVAGVGLVRDDHAHALPA